MFKLVIRIAFLLLLSLSPAFSATKALPSYKTIPTKRIGFFELRNPENVYLLTINATLALGIVIYARFSKNGKKN